MADNIPSGSEYRTGRSDSTASTTSTSTSNPASPTSPRRASHALFETLTAQKRKDDPISIARRQSMSEQRPTSGFIGKMWNNWVYGKK
ncbi:hypothetical protein C8A00DRAFT_33838 [Chaetomidium leptoderma]|uniref:Conidiation-specific protein 8 n=1 Tax=Chaetomidium leptoderma TaxID=669021 RepID=A0AAN6VKU9_9PEZI|nr:hypothetical protein C8A00DRAFT_33838 [Chaetomidium leptoderma]